MPSSPMSGLIEHLRKTVFSRERTGTTDGQLLESFLTWRDEVAFEELVHRHGPMVLGVCRRILGHLQDAEDAFQATFLVLVHKASSVVPRELVGNWLYGVAYRTALEARAMRARRRVKEKQAQVPPGTGVDTEPVCGDWQPLLDQEMSRLPDKYREPLVLCYLEGRTRKQVAEQLGIPEGTLSSRLATARSRLANRLARHGPLLSGVALAEVLAQEAAGCVPPALRVATIQAATLLAAGRLGAGVISTKVGTLTEGVLKAMFFTKLSAATGSFLAVVVVGMGLNLVPWLTVARQDPSPVARPNELQSNDQTQPSSQEPKPHQPAKAQDPGPAQAEGAHPDLHEHLHMSIHKLHGVAHPREPGRPGPEGTPHTALVAVGQKVPDFSVVDLDGKQATLADVQKDARRSEKGVVVLSFWCSFCGSCRKVEGALDKMRKQYEGKAAVIALDASAGETAEKVRAFTSKNRLGLDVLLDPTGRSADLFGTQVTTTTVVLDGAGILRYRGRFSDGTHAYAEEALRAVLAGKEVQVKTTPLEGCPIPRD